MSSRPHGFQPIDPGRVNARDPVELDYWCGQFGCDRDRLDEAIRRVGEHVTEIREELARQRPRPQPAPRAR